MRFSGCFAIAMLLSSVSTAVLADEWMADRLRGGVSILRHGTWAPLSRGEAVPDQGKVRTEADGRLELVRGKERVSLAENTQIEMRDAGSELMTSVIQSSGSVTVDAERRNVQHFSVQTPVLAAVVKGTHFTVTYDAGVGSVQLARGSVQVQDTVHDVVVDIIPGQTATVSRAEALEVTGRGADRIVYLIDGQMVPASARATVLQGGQVPSDRKITLDALSGAAAVGGGGRVGTVEAGGRVGAGAGQAGVSASAGPVGASVSGSATALSSPSVGASVTAGSAVSASGEASTTGASASVTAGGVSVGVGAQSSGAGSGAVSVGVGGLGISFGN